tara:strand:- start:578 stop:1420 length:843 start_codon:yes stop_codon:yes gene_type:complete
MSIRIISEGVYDTAHSIFEAHEIKKQRPDAVLLELPSSPFQKIFDEFNKGKMSSASLKKKLLAAIKVEKSDIQHDLLKQFLLGQVEEEELSAIETEGREIHVMQAAKNTGAELFAIDVPLDKLEKYLLGQFKKDHVERTRQIIETQQLPDILWKFSNILHYPFYILERIMRHNAIVTSNPYKHNVSECTVCRIGVLWDRTVHKLFLPMFMLMPLSRKLTNDMRLSFVIHKMDQYRERYMARRIAEEYQRLKKKLGREPRIIAIVHLWNANTIRKYLRGLK